MTVNPIDIKTFYCHNRAMETPRYTIDELAEKTGYSRRTIRYYVQEGILEPPAGRGRGGFYNDSHLATLRRVRAQQEQGLTLSTMVRFNKSEAEPQSATTREVWARYEVIPGLELHVSRDLEGRELRKLLEIVRMARAIMKEDMDAED